MKPYDPLPNYFDPQPAPIPKRPSFLAKLFAPRKRRTETREEHWRKVIAPAASERVNFWSRHGL